MLFLHKGRESNMTPNCPRTVLKFQ